MQYFGQKKKNTRCSDKYCFATETLLTCCRDHTECPVSACTCRCMQLDTTGNLEPLDSS